ncbi:hypothetical protein [Henriciella algicola]|uniref:Uncharacterized protein n=1 Tax=Henriciella algicola TaxID=1608422 RepID=A0A399RM38_9PROT|nr:hypothetical protein [Henriciella algicola]RIJ30909.1 hypothetical protein D1222_01170 [Henriciella algicola]
MDDNSDPEAEKRKVNSSSEKIENNRPSNDGPVTKSSRAFRTETFKKAVKPDSSLLASAAQVASETTKYKDLLRQAGMGNGIDAQHVAKLASSSSLESIARIASESTKYDNLLRQAGTGHENYAQQIARLADSSSLASIARAASESTKYDDLLRQAGIKSASKWHRMVSDLSSAKFKSGSLYAGHGVDQHQIRKLEKDATERIREADAEQDDDRRESLKRSAQETFDFLAELADRRVLAVESAQIFWSRRLGISVAVANGAFCAAIGAALINGGIDLSFGTYIFWLTGAGMLVAGLLPIVELWHHSSVLEVVEAERDRLKMDVSNRPSSTDARSFWSFKCAKIVMIAMATLAFFVAAVWTGISGPSHLQNRKTRSVPSNEFEREIEPLLFKISARPLSNAEWNVVLPAPSLD